METIYIVFDAFNKNEMFKSNQTFAENLQEESNIIVKLIFIGATCLMYPAGVGIILFFIYINLGDKVRILSCFSYFLIAVYLSTILKQVYYDPRPFWVYANVEKGFLCDIDFGNPSGHSFNSALIFPILVWELFQGNFHSKDESQLSSPQILDSPTDEDTPFLYYNTSRGFEFEKKNTIRSFSFTKKFIIILLTILLVGLVCISRIYLGSHSYNQVLLGIAYGSFCLVNFYTYGKDFLYNFLVRISFKRSNWESYSQSMYIILGVFLIITNLISIALFDFADGRFIMDPNYIVNINHKCSTNFEANSGIQFKIFNDSSVLNGLFGSILGIMVSKGEADTSLFRTNYKNLEFWKKIIRVIAILIVEIIPVLLMLSCDYLTDYPYPKYIATSISTFFAGFAFLYYLPILLRTMKLDIKGDYLAVTQ